ERDAVAEQIELVAEVDDALAAEDADRIGELDLVPVGREPQARNEARPEDDAGGGRVGLLRRQREAAAIEDRRRVVVARTSDVRVVDDAERGAFLGRHVTLEQLAETGGPDIA